MLYHKIQATCIHDTQIVTAILIELPINYSFHQQPLCNNYGFTEAWKQPIISFPLFYNRAFTEGMGLVKYCNRIAPFIHKS